MLNLRVLQAYATHEQLDLLSTVLSQYVENTEELLEDDDVDPKLRMEFELAEQLLDQVNLLLAGPLDTKVRTRDCRVCGGDNYNFDDEAPGDCPYCDDNGKEHTP